jgi:hypothetical protein
MLTGPTAGEDSTLSSQNICAVLRSQKKTERYLSTQAPQFCVAYGGRLRENYVCVQAETV